MANALQHWLAEIVDAAEVHKILARSNVHQSIPHVKAKSASHFATLSSGEMTPLMCSALGASLMRPRRSARAPPKTAGMSHHLGLSERVICV